VTSQTDRVRRAVELCVFAPIGVAVWLRDLAPTFVNMFVARGRAEIEKREEQVQQRFRTARGAGETALAFGVPVIKERLGSNHSEQSPPPAASSASPRREPVAETRPRPAAPVSVTTSHGGPAKAGASPGTNGAAAALAIPGYDALSASQVVERLVGLDGTELAAVRDYEAAHRNRRTILGKIDQLSASA